MQLKSNTNISVRSIVILVFLFKSILSEGQQTPISTISYYVFSPHIYNPAIVGSKDFLSIGLNTSFQGKSNTQILTGNTRFLKTKSGYFSSPKISEFSKIGIGGSVFNDSFGSFKNIGANVAGSFHIPLTGRKTSFISIGGAVKGVYNISDTSTVENVDASKSTFYPNVDLGIYYYGTNFFSGLSTTDLLGNPGTPDSLGGFEIPVCRRYFFTAGYKILLSRSMNIVLEPSVLVSAEDSTFNNIQDNINPILKLYIGNFCFGSYFLSNSKTSFFFQYRYPRLNIGAYYELPKKSPYFKKSPVIELTLGINIQFDKSRFSKSSRW